MAERLVLDAPTALGDDTLVFIHLPKTAGTAWRSSLVQCFDPVQRALIYGPGDLEGAMTRKRFDALPEAVRRDLRLVMGHFQFGIHRQLGRPSRYATVLRDPVERVISLYYHYRNLPGVRFGSRGYRERLRLRWRRISLEEWVFGERHIMADNYTVRNVAGGSGVPFGRCGDDLYARAMDNVQQHFVALLVTEDMARSRVALERTLGRVLPAIGEENANPRRPLLDEVEPRLVQRLRELNALDLRFHDAARAWLEGAT